MSAADILTVSSEFDIFAHKQIPTSVLDTIEIVYIPIAPVEESDLEFLIPADTDTYIDLDSNLDVRGKLVSGEGKNLDEKDFTAVTNNFLYSLFSQCNISINSVLITKSGDLFQYRSYLETLYPMEMTRPLHVLQTRFGTSTEVICCPVIPRQRVCPFLQLT